MSEKEEEGSYPLKSLHDFLDELDKEWGGFRTAALIGMITSVLLLIFTPYVFLVLLSRIRRFDMGFIEVLGDIIFLVAVAVFAVYEISLLLRQYRFFAKWERRVSLLLHLEERLMEGKEEKSGEPDKNLPPQSEQSSNPRENPP
jgi:hypothetical protein